MDNNNNNNKIVYFLRKYTCFCLNVHSDVLCSKEKELECKEFAIPVPLGDHSIHVNSYRR